MKPERLFRCEFSSGFVYIHSYAITKETPCGWWITPRKWVGNSGRKRFAWPSKEEAIKSFKARKIRQIKILEAQLESAREALDANPLNYVDLTDGILI